MSLALSPLTVGVGPTSHERYNDQICVVMIITPRITKLGAVLILLSLGATFAFGVPQKAEMVRIGLLWPLSASAAVPSQEAFVKGLRDLGWVEGRNLVIERRFADGRPDRLPGLAAELVGRNIDMIVTGSTPGHWPPSTRAARYRSWWGRPESRSRAEFP